MLEDTSFTHHQNGHVGIFVVEIDRNVGSAMDVMERRIYGITVRKSKIFTNEQLEVEIEGTLYFEICNLDLLEKEFGSVNENELRYSLIINIEGMLEQALETIDKPVNLLSDPVPFLNVVRIQIREYLTRLGLKYVEISPLKLIRESSVLTTTYD